MCLVIAFSVAVFASSTAETIGISAEGVAKGNAVVSTVHDWSSAFYNTAGLGRAHYGKKSAAEGTKTMALIKKADEGSAAAKEEKDYYPNEISLGVMYTHPLFEVDFASGSNVNLDPTEDLESPVLMVGLAIDLNLLYKLPEKIFSSARLGVAAALNADFSVAEINDVDLRSHNFLRYGHEARRLSAFVGAGLGFMKDMFGLGLGLNASFSGEGKVNLDNVKVQGAPQVPEGQAKMNLDLSPYAVCGFYFDFGKAVSVLEGLSLGASYRQESYLEIDPFPTITSIQHGNIMMLLQLAIFDYYSPHNVTAGVSYSRWGVTLEFDMEYQMWSMYKVSSKVKEVFENQVKVGLPDYDDILIYKIGISYDALSWLSVMVGYMYQPTFVPDEAVNDTVFNMMDNDKHIASVGASFTVGKYFGMQGPIKLTIAYQFQYLVPRTVDKNQTKIEASLADYSYENYDPTLNPGYSYGGTAHTILFGMTFML